MKESHGSRPMDEAAIVCLLIVAAGAALLTTDAAAIAGLPPWVGAAIGLCALLGMLWVSRRSGALRTGFMVMFAAVLVVAALYGWLFAAG